MNTFDNTYCRPIDWSKLPITSANLGNKIEVKGYGALVTTGKSPMLLDTEIVSLRASESGKFHLYVYDAPTVDEQGRTCISIFPVGEIAVDLETVEALCGEPMTIAEYIGDRRNYNGRLIANERDVTEWLND